MRRVRLFFALCLCGLPASSSGAQSQTQPPPLPPASSPPFSLPTGPAPAGSGQTASPRAAAAAPLTGTAPRARTTPPAPGRPGDAFFGDPNADPNTSIAYDADTVQTLDPNGTRVALRGNVQFLYRNYLLTSDRADINFDTREARFTGNVKITDPNGATVEGKKDGSLLLNLRTSTYILSDARTTLQPEALNVGVILPVFIYGGTLVSRPGFLEGRGSNFTTCDFLEPHYSFGARQVYVIPGSHLVAKNVSLYRKGHRILTLPYFYAPLNDRLQRQTLVPQVGQTPDEGYFIKFALGYALAAGLPGILRLDEMQRKGTGIGFDQTYGSSSRPGRGSGVVTLYRLYDQSTGLENINGTLQHQQRFGTLAASLSTQFQQNSYYAGTEKSNTLNNQLNLTRNVGNLDLALRTNLTQNSYGLGQSQTLTSAFQSAFRPTASSQLQTSFNYSGFFSPGFLGIGSDDRKQLDSNVDYTQHGKVDLEILGNKFTQLTSSSTSSSYFGGLERLPELRLATDAQRESFLKAFLPSSTRLNLSVGEFNEPTSLTRTERAQFGVDLGTTTRNFGSRNSVNYGGSFQQAFYGDDTAQYILNGRTGYRLRIGSKSSASVTYAYLRPYGFSPFQFDVVGRTNIASLNYNYQETRQFALTLGTGYDFNQTQARYGLKPAPWQNVSLQTLFAPGDIFRMRTTAAYDLNHNTLLDVTNAIRMRRGAFAVDVGSRYDPMRRRVSSLTGSLDLPFFRDNREDAGYRLRAIGGYNGYTSQYEYKGLALTRSWHDWEMSLIYQDSPNGLRPGSSFTFNFRLKAFPAYEPFTIGQYGQSLDTGVGQVF